MIKFEKRAYGIQMSLDVPDSERRVAEKAEKSFEQLIVLINRFLEQLNYIYIPFSELQQADKGEISNNRRLLRKYRDKLDESFKRMQNKAFEAAVLMGEFQADTAVEELMNSFTASMKALEKLFKTFVSIFSNINSPDFHSNLLNTIVSMQKSAAQLKQIVNDRVLNHIDTNILAKNWVSLMGNQLGTEVKQKLPLLVELYNERKKALNEA